MEVVAIVHWSFSPPDYFERDVTVVHEGHPMNISQGKVEASEPMPNNEALAVIRSLRRFRDDIDEIVNAIVDKRTISIDERDRLQALTSPANRSMHKPRRGAA